MAKQLKYTLKRTGLLGSGIRLSLQPTTAEVIVTAGKLIPQALIDQFIQEKTPWIEKNRQKILQKSKNLPTQVDIFGRSFQKKWGYFPDQKLGASIQDQNILLINNVQLKNSSQSASPPVLVNEKVDDFLKLTAEKYLRQRTPQLATQMGLQNQYRRLTIKKQATRWGSCSSDKNLNFNWALVHFPPPLIDYVIIHELAHLVHLNHSAAFWQLVAKYDPEHKKHRRLLNS